MLKQSFQTDLYPYTTGESANNLSGLFIQTGLRTPPSAPDQVFLVARVVAPVIGNLAFEMYNFDAVTGKYLTHKFFNESVFFSPDTVIQSRNGNTYWNITGGIFAPPGLYQFDSQTLAFSGTNYPASRYTGNGSTVPALSFLITPLIDEPANILMATNTLNGDTLYAYDLTTGVGLYSIQFPYAIQTVGLYLINQAFVLLANGFLVNIDYVANRVMGCVRIPNLLNPTDPLGFQGNFSIIGNQVQIVFYARYSRLLIALQTPDASGLSTVRVRGYYVVPLPTKITPPIPLSSPLVGKSGPVLVQTMDESNFPRSSGSVALTSADSTILAPVSFSFPDSFGVSKITMSGLSVGSTLVSASMSYIDPLTGVV